MVYIISDGEYKKIGVSNDEASFQMRLTMLQGGNARKFKVLNRINGDYKTEAMLHRTLKNYRVFREWFKFDFNIDQELVDLLYEIDKEDKIRRKELITRRNSSRELKKSKINQAIKRLESKNDFITHREIAGEASICFHTVKKIIELFKDRINEHNIKVSGTSDYNEFISNKNIELLKEAIIKLKKQNKKINKNTISLISGLHRNTVSRILKKNNINIKK